MVLSIHSQVFAYLEKERQVANMRPNIYPLPNPFNMKNVLGPFLCANKRDSLLCETIVYWQEKANLTAAAQQNDRSRTTANMTSDLTCPHPASQRPISPCTHPSTHTHTRSTHLSTYTRPRAHTHTSERRKSPTATKEGKEQTGYKNFTDGSGQRGPRPWLAYISVSLYVLTFMFFGPSAQTFSATSPLINFFWFSLSGGNALKRSLKKQRTIWKECPTLFGPAVK